MKWADIVPAAAAMLALVPASAPAAQAGSRDSLVAGSNAFAFDLYGRLSQARGNLFFSPFSVHGAIAMAYAGAQGGTAKAMARTMHYPAPPGALGAAYAMFLHDLRASARPPGAKQGATLEVANALWSSDRVRFAPAFVTGLQRDYGGVARSLDFSHAQPAADTINAWVAGQTHQRIRDLIPAGALGERTACVLTNAIYFHADWATPFLKESTRARSFHRTGKDSTSVRTMSQLDEMDYGQTPAAQLLSLPYAGHKLSMVIVLPNRRDGLPALERSLGPKALAGWLRHLAPRRVDLQLPRFTFARAAELGEALRALGMKVAFDPATSDFAGMTGGQRTFLSGVFHKAFVAVDETGTEAAAATGGVMGVTMAKPHPTARPVVFHANHPFLFLIRDGATGAILFMGRVADPG